LPAELGWGCGKLCRQRLRAVHAQAADHGDWLGESLAPSEQVKHGVTTIRNDD
jgi:hypothetical protein